MSRRSQLKNSTGCLQGIGRCTPASSRLHGGISGRPSAGRRTIELGQTWSRLECLRQAPLGAREPLLEGGGERGIAVHLDTVLFRLAATHQHPVEAFSRSTHGDIGLRMTGFGHRLTVLGPQHPFTFGIGAVYVEARRLAFTW